MQEPSVCGKKGKVLFMCTLFVCFMKCSAGDTKSCEDNIHSEETLKTMGSKQAGAGMTPAIPDIVLRAPDTHEATLIFMHGLGDTGKGWDDTMRQIQGRFPSLKMVLPSAPKVPVSLNGGMKMPAWYDIKGLGARSNETCDGIDASFSRIQDLIKSERAAHPGKKVFLGGFSQGGAMTLYTGLQQAEPLDGLIVLSGYMPCPAGFESKAVQAKTVPILMCHGDADQIVKLDWATQSKEGLEKLGYKFDFNVFRGLPHSLNNNELDKIMSFLQTQL